VFNSGNLRKTVIAVMLLDFACVGRVQAATASVSYGYDQLGRLATALYDEGTCIVYVYDASGNRTAQTNTTAGTPNTATWGTGTWGCAAWASGGSGELKLHPVSAPDIDLADLSYTRALPDSFSGHPHSAIAEVAARTALGAASE
jgi:YD repeat-containing protein